MVCHLRTRPGLKLKLVVLFQKKNLCLPDPILLIYKAVLFNNAAGKYKSISSIVRRMQSRRGKISEVASICSHQFPQILSHLLDSKTKHRSYNFVLYIAFHLMLFMWSWNIMKAQMFRLQTEFQTCIVVLCEAAVFICLHMFVYYVCTSNQWGVGLDTLLKGTVIQ